MVKKFSVLQSNPSSKNLWSNPVTDLCLDKRSFLEEIYFFQLQVINTIRLGALSINVWTRKTSTGIDCWSCEQGNSNVIGRNFGPEECQKYGRFTKCQREQVNDIYFRQPRIQLINIKLHTLARYCLLQALLTPKERMWK